MISPCGWIRDPLHHDAFMFDLHQKIEIVKNREFENYGWV
jgi:hypothetical protein